MSTVLSKTQIDKLGERLKSGQKTGDDIRMLDQFRRGFAPGYEAVIQRIREDLDLAPSGRPGKSTNSIIEKLQREHLRLSQMQDIAGCRIVVSDIEEQHSAVEALIRTFGEARIVDRRTQPSYGYRAVHIIAKQASHFVEIQVRTMFQHLWAELSERYSDVTGFDMKHGQGPAEALEEFGSLSAELYDVELHDYSISEEGLAALYPNLDEPTIRTLQTELEIEELREQFEIKRLESLNHMAKVILEMQALRGSKE